MQEIKTDTGTALASFRDHGQDIREQYFFPNGRGVSIIRHRGSYGYSSGLFELAVLDPSGELDYSTPVTGDVEGWLSFAEVVKLMHAVADLPPATGEVED